MHNVTVKHSYQDAFMTECFCNAIHSLQYSVFYVLYCDLDWSENEVVQYSYRIKELHEKLYETVFYEDFMKKFEEIGLDFRSTVDSFPTSIKMAFFNDASKKHKNLMRGKGVKYLRWAVFAGVDDAIETYFCEAAYILITEYGYDADKILHWWECVKKMMENYRLGMKDEHVEEYFRKFSDLIL